MEGMEEVEGVERMDGVGILDKMVNLGGMADLGARDQAVLMEGTEEQSIFYSQKKTGFFLWLSKVQIIHYHW